MGCSSSKLDHLQDSLHVMLSNETRTKIGTGVPRKNAEVTYRRRESSVTVSEDLDDSLTRTRHMGLMHAQ